MSNHPQSGFAEYDRQNNRDVIAGVVILIPALACAYAMAMWFLI